MTRPADPDSTLLDVVMPALPERETGEPAVIRVDGQEIKTRSDVTVAVAMLNAGIDTFRASVTGAPRGPLCAMGTCYECRVTVDGRPGRRSCLEPCRDGMEVETGG